MVSQDAAALDAAKLATTARNRARVGMLLSLTLLGLLALMWLVLSLSTDAFMTPNNITNLLRQGAMTAILAIGATFVIITAGIDLSVGAVVGFSSVIVAWLLTHDFPIWASILITLAMGLGIGLFHGFGIVRLGLPPFIMTLATLTALRGIGLLITNGATISITNDAFTGFSRGSFLGLPNLFWMVVLVAVPAYVLLHQTRWGRYLFAIGSAQKVGSDRLRLTDIVVYQYPDLPGTYGEVFTARTGSYRANVWTLENARLHRYRADGTTAFDAKVETVTIPLRVNFSQVFSLPLREDQLAFAELTQRAEGARRLGQLQDARKYEVERWFKLSLPAMCLVFALCAPPLSLRFARTGAFTGVLLSIIVVFVAWNTLLLMKYVGLGGYLPPAVAAWSTNALFTLVGAVLLRTQE